MKSKIQDERLDKPLATYTGPENLRHRHGPGGMQAPKRTTSRERDTGRSNCGRIFLFSPGPAHTFRVNRPPPRWLIPTTFASKILL
jgi:hypothetical protein